MGKDHPGVTGLWRATDSAEALAVFIILVINAVLDVGVFARAAEGIVERYYTQELRAAEPADFKAHVVMLMLFVVLELLSFCVVVTLVLVLCKMAWRLATARAPQWCLPSPQGVPPSHPTGGCVTQVPWVRVAAAGLGVGGLFFSLAEAQMLLDMGVHVMDAELMAIAGVGVVVQRRVTLGVDLPTQGWRLVVLGFVFLVLLEPILVVVSGRVAERASRKHKQRTAVATGVLWVVLYAVVSSRSRLLTEKVTQFSQVRVCGLWGVGCDVCMCGCVCVAVCVWVCGGGL
jgi:hypothetical protein